MWYPAEYTRLDGTKTRLRDDEAPPIFRFHTKPNGDCDIGEDFAFCWKARRLGYSVKLDTRILMGHLKSVDLSRLFTVKAYMAAHFGSLEEQLA